MVKSFDEFCGELLRCGFSMGGGNAKGIFSVVPSDAQAQAAGSPVRWHTGNKDTDPWEWRMRALLERQDIAYGKVFLGVSGYISREWYPFFLAVRRQGLVFDEWYDDGRCSRMEKEIYEAICENGRLALHELKSLCSIKKESAGRLDRALVNLQKNLFITMCGHKQKSNSAGEDYGWSSTMFCTTEEFWGGDISSELPAGQAFQKIHGRVLELNPAAEEKVIRKFISG